MNVTKDCTISPLGDFSFFFLKHSIAQKNGTFNKTNDLSVSFLMIQAGKAAISTRMHQKSILNKTDNN